MASFDDSDSAGDYLERLGAMVNNGPAIHGPRL